MCGGWSRASGCASTLFDMHKPVIAQVHGTCIGIGTDLAWLCDMVIVADDARIGFPPVRDLGTPPGSMWLYHCGPQWAKRLLFTGDSVTGTDAARIGLALKSVPAAQLEAEVMRLADRMGLVDPHLLSANKRLVNLGLELMGARTLQRIGAEIDARGHLAPKARDVPRRRCATHGVKYAFQKRDAAFGSGLCRGARAGSGLGWEYAGEAGAGWSKQGQGALPLGTPLRAEPLEPFLSGFGRGPTVPIPRAE